VLVVIMNWFLHKLYWTGWITLHTDRKRRLVKGAEDSDEVVLFLQSYRLKLGTGPVFLGVLIGLAFTLVVALLTFVGHRRLPYKKMLVATGVMLGVVLVVMVGEQAQEMQLAHWLSTTKIAWLDATVPGWMGLWFAIFPTVETLAAQALAVLLVLGSYLVASLRSKRSAKARRGGGTEMRAEL
jgi:high-affinity iron transporter